LSFPPSGRWWLTGGWPWIALLEQERDDGGRVFDLGGFNLDDRVVVEVRTRRLLLAVPGTAG
jgi:hypothetical protein